MGGVRVGLSDAAAVEEAFEEIMTAARRHAPTARLEGVLVQEMVSGGIELIAGLSRQEPFGMGVVAGAGGVLVELMGDTALDLCPFDVAEIIEARTREIFEKLGEQMAKGSHGHRLPAGLVLTGGGALLAGPHTSVARCWDARPCRDADGHRRPHRRAADTVLRDLDGPAAVGGACRDAHEPQRYESAPSGGSLGKAREWLRTLFP